MRVLRGCYFHVIQAEYEKDLFDEDSSQGSDPPRRGTVVCYGCYGASYVHSGLLIMREQKL